MFFCKSTLSEDYLKKIGMQKAISVGVGQNFDKFNIVHEPTEKVKKILQIISKKRTLLSVGSIDDRKNFPFMLAVLNEIMKIDENYQLVVIGKGSKGYISKCLKKYSKKLNDNVILLGNVENSQLKFIYPSVYTFLMPSKLEIFGMALLEAMSFGAVPIASSNGGSMTLIKEGENGYIRALSEPKKWAQLITSKNFFSKRKELSKKSKERIIKNFTWEKIVNNMIEKID
jgi:glycosyltransferase involved in cell wall biosynthesis